MPTAKPRITVTMEQHSYDVLSRLSRAGGESMSALVAQFIEVSIPSLERLVVVLERAVSAPQEARDGLLAAVQRAERTLLPALISAQDMGDLFITDLEAASVKAPQPAHAQRGRAASTSPVPARTDPRPVTRGSGLSERVRKGGSRG